MRVQVLDANGQPMQDAQDLYAEANVSGEGQSVYSPFSYDRDQVPLDLAVRSDTLYDIKVQLADGKTYTAEKQRVTEGQVLNLKLKIEDFR